MHKENGALKLEDYLAERRAKKPILLMTHIVIGYPDLATSYEIMRTMVAAGVDLIEMQIPFSEPIADGPVILQANQAALANGVTVDECLEFAARATAEFDIPLLFMTYYNIVYRRGPAKFVADMAEAGVVGAIVPDLPPEEAGELLEPMAAAGLHPVYIYSPNTSLERQRYIDQYASGFIYCVARKGVTGMATDFAQDLDDYLSACRSSTSRPLALGFGVKDAADVAFLAGKVDVAVVGSEVIRIVDAQGVAGVREFITGLRDAG